MSDEKGDVDETSKLGKKKKKLTTSKRKGGVKAPGRKNP